VELVIIGVPLGVFAFVILLMVINNIAKRARDRVKGILTELARKRGGELDFLDNTTWWGAQDQDAAVIPAEGLTFRVRREIQSAGDSTIEYTYVSTEVPVRHKLDVFEEGFMSSLGKMVGRQDIVIGYPTFDDLFIIRSSNITWAKAVLALNHDVRMSHEGFREAIVSLKDGELILRKLGTFAELPVVEEMLDLAIAYAVAIRDTEPPLLTDETAAGALTMTRATGTEGGLEVARAGDGALTPADD